MDTVQNQNANESNEGAIEHKASELGRKADAAGARLQHTWEDATSSVKSRLGTTKEQVRYKMQLASEKAKQKLGNAKTATVTKSRDAKIKVEGQVQSHPIKSVAVAFGAGALLGVLLTKGRR